MCGKGQELELHPDDLLFLEDWQKGSVLGQELWLWCGRTQGTGVARPEKVTVQSSISTWSQLMHKSFAARRQNICSNV